MAKKERAVRALRFLATYHKSPPEIVKDDFAYDRLLDFVHRVALVGLGELNGTDDPAYTRCTICYPEEPE